MYLDDDVWTVLHTQAQSRGTTISDLVRVAVRDRYLGDLQQRREAMQTLVGIRKDRTEFEDVDTYVRDLRRGARLEKAR